MKIVVLLFFFILYSISTYSYQWNMSSGPERTTIYCIENIGSNIFIGTVGGIFKSTNNGENWIMRNNPALTTETIYDLLYNNNFLFAAAYGKVYRTSNEGISWTVHSSGLPPNTLGINTMAKNGNYIFVGGISWGVYRSSNDGTSWVRAGLDSLIIMELLSFNNKIYAAGTDYLYTSTNNGNDWSTIPSLPAGLSIYCLAENNGVIFAAGDLSTAGKTYRSTNEGISWDLIHSGIPINESIYDFAFYNTTIIGTTGYNMYYSNNVGNNWSLLNNLDAWRLWTNDTILICNDSVLAKSIDGGLNWIRKVSGINACNITSFSLLNGNIYCGTGFGCFNSTNYGAGWNELNSGLNSSIQSLYFYNQDLYAGSFGNIYYSSNYGNNWQPIGNGLNPGLIYYVTNNGSFLFAAGRNIPDAKIYRSDNNGQNWEVVNGNLPSIIDIVSIASSGSTVFAGVLDLTFSGFTGVIKSTNNGLNWIAANNGISTNEFPRCFLVRNNEIFIGTGYGVYTSSNNGSSWVHKSSGLPNDLVNSLCTARSYLFAGFRNNGVYYSSNNGNSWYSLNNGLLNLSINSVYADSINLYAGTLSSSVWYCPLSEVIIGIKKISSNVPVDFILHQNYPNPFNPVTKIKFDLPKASNVSIKLYDVIGNEVVQIYSGDLQAGYFEADFNASSYASGVYFYRITAGDFTSVKRMVLVK